jgi:DNA mismatch repair ATPase MutS
VELLVNHTLLRQSLQEEHFRGVSDVDKTVRRFQAGKASLQLLVSLYQFVIR